MSKELFKSGTWYPIESAPKDRTEILVVCGVEVTIVKWEEHLNVFMDREAMFLYSDYSEEPVAEFTHWMPLPESPKEIPNE